MEIQKDFETKWNFPLCCGAIDRNHVATKCPPGSCSEFYNYKGGYSIILLPLVDADCKFLYINVGTNGTDHDTSVFQMSLVKLATTVSNKSIDNTYNNKFF